MKRSVPPRRNERKARRRVNREEMHHVVGRRNNPDLKCPLCPTCHRAVHKKAREAGCDLKKRTTLLHRMVAAHRLRGALLSLLGNSMMKDADDIEAVIDGLNEEYPNWRQMPEAK